MTNLLFVIGVLLLFITIVPYSFAQELESPMSNNCYESIYNFCVSISDILIGIPITVGLSLVIVYLQRILEKNSKKSMLKKQFSAIITTLEEIQKETKRIEKLFKRNDRIPLLNITNQISRLSMSILELYNINEYEMFSERILVWQEILNSDENNADKIERTHQQMITFLIELKLRY